MNHRRKICNYDSSPLFKTNHLKLNLQCETSDSHLSFPLPPLHQNHASLDIPVYSIGRENRQAANAKIITGNNDDNNR